MFSVIRLRHSAQTINDCCKFKEGDCDELGDDLKEEVREIFKTSWTKRDGRVVPDREDIQLGNDAVEFGNATVLYADLTGSTELVNDKSWSFSAEVYKTYLYCAAKLIRSEGGAVTSYDGDRVMDIFVGDVQSSPAARCGLKINYVVQEIINPALAAQYPSVNFQVRQVVGIDTSSIRAARTGVRGGNDIVWVGRAANYAAKLTELKLDVRTWVTKDTYDRMHEDVKLGSDSKVSMWKEYKWSQNGDILIYGSTWRRNI
jgi:class 3 adenylate cyclase